MLKNTSLRFVFINFNLMTLLLISCGNIDSPEDVAEDFLFRYFIELNQTGALQVSTGLAEKKLKKEIELLQSVRMQPNLDLSEHKPFIDYKLVNTQTRAGDSFTLYYDVSIESKSGEKRNRKMVLSVAKLDGVWKINNYDIFDPKSP